MVTICTTSLTFNNSTFCPHSVFMCFVWIWEQTAIISLFNINWLVCVTETDSVYCAVRAECNCISVRYIPPHTAIVVPFALRMVLSCPITLCMIVTCHITAPLSISVSEDKFLKQVRSIMWMSGTSIVTLQPCHVDTLVYAERGFHSWVQYCVTKRYYFIWHTSFVSSCSTNRLSVGLSTGDRSWPCTVWPLLLLMSRRLTLMC